MYALANDENGVPLEVPAGAFGWLVRRHAGGKGRPGVVYDPDGRPLVVPLDATASELVEMGVKAGRYRLDAVDDQRRQLGATAYTEVRGPAVEDEVGRSPDAAVMALAKAVEAMQRVQAERERMQAQMFMRLIDRLAPVPIRAGDDLKGALGQMLEVQKAVKKLAPATVTPRNAAGEEEGETWWNSRAMAGALESIAPLVTKWAWSKMGIAPDEPNGSVEAPQKLSVASEERAVKLQAVLEELTEEERAMVDVALKTLPAAAIVQAQEELLSLPPKEAAEFVRSALISPAPPGVTSEKGDRS